MATNRWRFAWAWTLGAVLVLAGCGGVVVVDPQPPAPPSADLPPDGSRVCEPGDTCGCAHKPPGQDWQRLPDCPGASPLDCDGPVGANTGVKESTHAEAIKQAAIRAFDCYGGRCVVHASRFEVQRRFVQELRAMGYCSGQHEPGTSVENYGSDEIALAASNTSPTRESYHVAVGPKEGPVTLLLPPQGTRESYTTAPAGPAPAPGPSPAPTPPTPGPPPAPPAGDCPAPLPARVWTEATLPDGWGREEIGRPRWQLNCRPHGRVIDCTPVVIRNEPHCAAIGLSPYADGQPRQSCPVRPDGHPDRVACEGYLLGGELVLEARNGAACARTASTMFEPNGGNCRLCSTDKAVCSEWF